MRLKAGALGSATNPQEKEQYDMKHLKIAGLCLVAVFVMGMVVSASASAAGPVWEQCRTEKNPTEPPTRWSDSKCSVASSTGAWQWEELKTTEQVSSQATLRLIDTKATGGESAIQCGGTDNGWIGPNKYDQITSISVKASNCKRTAGLCITVEEVKPIHLPWQTELFETEGRIRDKLTEAGNGQPGWKVKCSGVEDVCESVAGEEGSTLESNEQATGVALGEFDGKYPKVKCSIGGPKSGEVRGLVQFHSTEGWAIRVQ